MQEPAGTELSTAKMKERARGTFPSQLAIGE